ncbi:MAG: PKD domain-containing protein [Bacteroidetes bacterium]|nr:PKD domain-containing protein [Bacteroidota bacterium]
MKKIPIFFALLLVPFITFSQITYNYSNYANPSDTFRISNVQNLEMLFYDFSETDTGYTWIYDDFSVTTQKTTRFLDPDDSDYRLTWIAQCVADGNWIWNCYSAWDDATNLCRMREDSLVLGQVEISDYTDFYNKKSNSLENSMIGLSLSYGQLPVKKVINFSDPDTIYYFPLYYQSTGAANSAWELDMTSIGIDMAMKYRQSREYTVEGWGELTTPYKYFPSVLKVRTEIHHHDSTTLYGISLPPDSTTDVIYEWFSADYGIPFLKVEGKLIASFETYTKISFIDTLRCLDPNAYFGYVPVTVFLDQNGEADVSFTNLSSNSDFYTWDFGDGTSSSQTNPSHTYNDAGTYMVQLTAGNSICDPVTFDSITLPVVVLDSNEVYASFSYSPWAPCTGDTVFFTSNSLNATDYYWDFGDGTTSTQQDPSHVFQLSGFYDVTLIACNGPSCDTAVNQVVVNSSDIDAGNDTTISQGESAGLHVSGNMGYVPYYWEYDPTLSCTICQDPTATPDITTTYVVSTTGVCGTVTDSVTVFVIPTGISDRTGKPSVYLYPNPVIGKLTVSAGDINKVEITGITGVRYETVFSAYHRNGCVIDLENLDRGIYYVTIFFKEGRICRSVVKM